MKINNQIKEIERELKEFVICRNPLLKKMKKENWIVNVRNKAMICWAGIHTLELLKERIKENGRK